ncbi:MAG: hypothetical protein ACXVZU_04160 [Methanobacteriaceae archaeon]
MLKIRQIIQLTFSVIALFFILGIMLVLVGIIGAILLSFIGMALSIPAQWVLPLAAVGFILADILWIWYEFGDNK